MVFAQDAATASTSLPLWRHTWEMASKNTLPTLFTSRGGLELVNANGMSRSEVCQF